MGLRCGFCTGPRPCNCRGAASDRCSRCGGDREFGCACDRAGYRAHTEAEDQAETAGTAACAGCGKTTTAGLPCLECGATPPARHYDRTLQWDEAYGMLRRRYGVPS
jgi:hypothetical protein